MEAAVRAMTGLLPAHLEAIRLQALEDGSWQTLCESASGPARRHRFASGREAEAKIASTLEADLGFTSYAAHETARRLFEPFDLAADWSW